MMINAKVDDRHRVLSENLESLAKCDTGSLRDPRRELAETLRRCGKNLSWDLN